MKILSVIAINIFLNLISTILSLPCVMKDLGKYFSECKDNKQNCNNIFYF